MKLKAIILGLIIVVSIFSILPVEAVHIPPTRAFLKAIASNGTISAKNYSSPLYFQGLRGIKIFESNNTNTLFFNATLANGTTFTPIKCSIDYQLHSLSSMGVFTCAKNNATGGSSSSFDTMQNIGGGQASIYAGNNTNTNFQFKTITATGSLNAINGSSLITIYGHTYQNNTGTNLGSSGIGIYTSTTIAGILQFLRASGGQGITVSSNSTNFIISTNFKVDNVNCSTNYYVSTFSNSTGQYTCTLLPVVKAIQTINGNDSSVQTIAGKSGQITVTDSGSTHTIGLAIKVNNVSCSSGYFVSAFSNSTGQYTCNQAITLINSQAGSMITIQGTSRNVTVTTTPNTVTINLGDLPVIVNGMAQNITKSLTLDLATLGGKLNAHNYQINSLGNATHKNDAVNARMLGLLGNLTLNKCSDSQFIQYKNFNQTWVCRTLANATFSNSNGIAFNETYANGRGIVNNTHEINFINGSGIQVLVKKAKDYAGLANQRLNVTISSSDLENLNYTTVSSNYVASKNDQLILVNTTSGNFTITLPSISTAGNGKLYTIKKIDYSKNFAEIIPSSATIDGFNNINITNPKDIVGTVNDGSNWHRTTKPIFAVIDNPLRSGTNDFYGSWNSQDAPTTLSLVNNTLYATPFVVSRNMAISQIESEITNAGIGSNCRMGIYTDSGSGYPLNLLKGSDVSAITTQTRSLRTIISNFTNNINLLEGLYWLGLDCNDGTVAGGRSTITVDNTEDANGTNVSSLTINGFTVGSGTNPLLLAGIGWRWSGTTEAPTISSVKWGSTSLSLIVQHANPATGAPRESVAIYGLLNPARSTSNNLVVTFSGATGTANIATVGAVSFFGVSQSALPSNTATDDSTSSSTSNVSITTTQDGSVIFDTMAFNSDSVACVTSTAGGSQTVEFNVGDGSCPSGGTQPTVSGSIQNAATVGTYTNSWTSSESGHSSAQAGLEILNTNGFLSGSMPSTRALTSDSVYPILGMKNTMGPNNGGTMYSVSYTMGSSVNALPFTFPTNAAIQISSIPEILVKVVG